MELSPEPGGRPGSGCIDAVVLGATWCVLDGDPEGAWSHGMGGEEHVGACPLDHHSGFRVAELPELLGDRHFVGACNRHAQVGKNVLGGAAAQLLSSAGNCSINRNRPGGDGVVWDRVAAHGAESSKASIGHNGLMCALPNRPTLKPNLRRGLGSSNRSRGLASTTLYPTSQPKREDK